MKGLLKGRLRASKLPLEKAITGLPPDKLDNDHLVQQDNLLLGQSGIPTNADSLAYEPIQRLLAIGTSDGRVKLVGQPGVERTLYASEHDIEGTNQLMFLFNRGVILRVSKAGVLDMWPVDPSKDSDITQPVRGAVIKLPDDRVTFAAAMARDPYIVLGCKSGAVRFAAVVSHNGHTIGEARQVQGLKLLPYKVTSQELEGLGEVTFLASRSSGPHHRILCLHGKSGAVIWDLRARCRVTAMTLQRCGIVEVKDAGAITATCWVTEQQQRTAFATAHEFGGVFLWSFPTKQEVFNMPLLECTLQLSDRTQAPIRSLTYVAGTAPFMLVLGGQNSDAPLSLSKIPLRVTSLGQPSSSKPEVDEKVRPDKLPWFAPILGFALVPQKGSLTGLDNPSAIIMVVEKGQLLVHDLQAKVPINFTLPFQSLSPTTLTACYSIPYERIPTAPVGSMNAELLRKCAASVSGEKGSSRDSEPWAWVLSGGAVPKAEHSPRSSVYCTGHADGCVRLWDVFAEMPTLVAVAPSKLPEEDALRPVSAMELCWQAGLLAVGHERGDVRLYQLSDRAREIECVRFETPMSSSNPSTRISEAAGLQLRMRVTVHSADITCLALCSTSRLLAVGDRGGGVSLLDVSKPALLWYALPSAPANHPLVSVAIGNAYLPPPKERSDPTSQGDTGRVVFLATADTSMAALNAANGILAGKSGWMKPKNTSQAISMALLELDGSPLALVNDPLATLGTLSGATSTDSRAEVRSPTAAQSQGSGRLAGQRSMESSGSAGGRAGATTLARADTEEYDEDDFLAMAAANVDGVHTSGDAPQPKGLTALMRQGSSSTMDSGDHSPPPSPKGKAHHRKGGSSSPGPSSPSHPASAADLMASTTPRASSDFEASAPSFVSPSAQEGTAAYVLLVTTGHLRLYSCPGVICGDRATEKKVTLSSPPVFAKVLELQGAPGLLLVTQPHDPHLMVYTLPGLELRMQAALSAVLPWWQLDAGLINRMHRLVACTHDGHMTLMGAGAELAHLGLSHDLSLAKACSLYDWELAAAAHAAKLCAMDSRSGPGTPGRHRSEGERMVADAAAEPGPAPSEPAPGAKPKPHGAATGVSGVFRKVTAVAKGMVKLVDKMDHDLTRLMNLAPDEAEPAYSHPELSAVLNCVSPLAAATQAKAEDKCEEREDEAGGDDDDDVSELMDPEDGGSSPGPPAAAVSPTSATASAARTSSIILPFAGLAAGITESLRSSTGSRLQLRSARPPSDETGLDSQEARERAELMSGAASPSVTAGSKPRTADEIRAKYGRPAAAAKRAGDVGSVMAENKAKLAERGEKLSQLDEKSSALEESAIGFAEMARQMAEKEKNKKWWQM